MPPARNALGDTDLRIRRSSIVTVADVVAVTAGTAPGARGPW